MARWSPLINRPQVTMILVVISNGSGSGCLVMQLHSLKSRPESITHFNPPSINPGWIKVRRIKYEKAKDNPPSPKMVIQSKLWNLERWWWKVSRIGKVPPWSHSDFPLLLRSLRLLVWNDNPNFTGCLIRSGWGKWLTLIHLTPDNWIYENL